MRAATVRTACSAGSGLLRNRDYALLLLSQAGSFVGDRVHFVALSLWLYAMTGSALTISLAIASLTAGQIAFGLLGGALVDRWPKKTVMITTDVLRAGLVAALPRLGHVGLWAVYADLVLVAAASSVFRPALLAVVPAVAGRERLLGANSLLAAVETGSEVVGPLVAGVVVAAWGPEAGLYFDAATFLWSGLVLVGLRTGAERTGSGTGWGVLKEIREGIRLVLGTPVQRDLFGVVYSVYVLAGLTSLQTPLARGTVGLDDLRFGMFQSVWGVGFVFASAVMPAVGRRIATGRLIHLGAAAYAVSAALMGLSRTFPALLASAFAVGAANVTVYINTATALMSVTPAEYMGRVFAFRQVALAAVRGTSLVAFGALGDAVGPGPAILLMSALSAVLVARWISRTPRLAALKAVGREPTEQGEVG